MSGCSFCSGSDKDHPRCSICDIAVGPGHHQEEYRIRDGKIVCSHCEGRKYEPDHSRAFESWLGLLHYYRTHTRIM